jgi:2-keto-4-pentenoate hydratase/2-oxohepta-3-ene-1,7-dioic acid hydratase in catechol pathway
MKLATFNVQGSYGWGVIDGGKAIDLVPALGKKYPSLRAFLAESGNYDELAAAMPRGIAHDLASITWLPVIDEPGKILCIGLNYETHRIEAGRASTGHPSVFIRFADSQMGHDAPILRPKVSTDLDYEGELAIVIGRGGRYIPRDEAMAHVAGYACYNDATVRDWQRHTIQFTPGKNFPGTGAFGPWMVTADEISDPATLHIETRVNGNVMQSAGVDQLIFDIPTLIEYCSSFTPLRPGDVIATGTPGGVGFKREPPFYIQPGDLVEVEIPGVGLLKNVVADEHTEHG